MRGYLKALAWVLIGILAGVGVTIVLLTQPWFTRPLSTLLLEAGLLLDGLS
jgi:hypothetical protein